MIDSAEYMMLQSALRPTIRKQEVYYLDPRHWLTWDTVIALLQEKCLIASSLTDDGIYYGYMVIEKLARKAMEDYRIATTYKPSPVFEQFIENELDIP